jgi:hypothetical protein
VDQASKVVVRFHRHTPRSSAGCSTKLPIKSRRIAAFAQDRGRVGPQVWRLLHESLSVDQRTRRSPMMLPRENTELDWRSLWASLLQGAGAGLLEHDGSRIAQAALAGLQAFDAAQERRRRWGEADHPRSAELALWSAALQEMSPTEQAAFLRLGREQQLAYLAELAELQDGPYAGNAHAAGTRSASAAPPPPAFGADAQRNKKSTPHSPNPFEGSYLRSIVPFGAGGVLNLPTDQR